jgi:hypothetical protein
MLLPESRLDFGKPSTVEHNIPVALVGEVDKKDLRKLNLYFRRVNRDLYENYELDEEAGDTSDGDGREYNEDENEDENENKIEDEIEDEGVGFEDESTESQQNYSVSYEQYSRQESELSGDDFSDDGFGDQSRNNPTSRQRDKGSARQQKPDQKRRAGR